MISPADVEMTRDTFMQVARTMFPDADNETLEKLYSMTRDLRALAAHVSRIAMNPDSPLSETARGE